MCLSKSTIHISYVFKIYSVFLDLFTAALTVKTSTKKWNRFTESSRCENFPLLGASSQDNGLYFMNDVGMSGLQGSKGHPLTMYCPL